MNLLLLEPDEINSDATVVLSDRRAEHLRKVLKVSPGKTLRAGILGGAIGEATVEEATSEEADAGRIRLRLDIPNAPAQRPPLDLIVALPRPQALHRVVQSAAVLGVGELALCNSWKVEKSYFDSPSATPEKIRHHLRLGAEQGGTTWLPEARVEKLLVPFLRSLGAPARDELRLIAHPGTECGLEEVATHLPAKITVAIGPERGWIDREIETFGEAGFRPVSLGPRILKTEMAVVALLAQIDLLRRFGEDLGPRPRS